MRPTITTWIFLAKTKMIVGNVTFYVLAQEHGVYFITKVVKLYIVNVQSSQQKLSENEQHANIQCKNKAHFFTAKT
jgi:hypothetical protein